MYDVAVIGGGISGCMAAIAAARCGVTVYVYPVVSKICPGENPLFINLSISSFVTPRTT